MILPLRRLETEDEDDKLPSVVREERPVLSVDVDREERSKRRASGPATSGSSNRETSCCDPRLAGCWDAVRLLIRNGRELRFRAVSNATQRGAIAWAARSVVFAQTASFLIDWFCNLAASAN